MGNEHSEICGICTRVRVVMGVRNRLRVSGVRPPQRATLSRKCRFVRDSVCPARRNYDAYASCLKCWIANRGTRRRATKRSGCLLTFVAGNRSWHGNATSLSMKLKDELHVGDIRLTEHRGCALSIREFQILNEAKVPRNACPRSTTRIFPWKF